MGAKVTLFTNNEELFHSFKRALKALADIELLCVIVKNNTVIFDMNYNTDIDTWLWGDLRTKKRALNPLIVIGTEEKSKFIANQPVFDTYSDVHTYLKIPFDLRELLSSINRLKPIYDNITRKLIVNEYSKRYEHTLITHDLKIIKGNLEATIDNFVKVKDFYYYREQNKIAKIIDERINEMQSKGNWEEIAFEIQQYLEERLKGTK